MLVCCCGRETNQMTSSNPTSATTCFHATVGNLTYILLQEIADQQEALFCNLLNSPI